MKEETIQATNRVREAEKAHNIRTFSQGRGAKKKGPNCIQIRVLLWCRKRGSAPAAKKAPLGLFLNAASTPVHHNNKGAPKGAPLVLEAGVEPARCRHHGILSPVSQSESSSFRRRSGEPGEVEKEPGNKNISAGRRKKVRCA